MSKFSDKLKSAIGTVAPLLGGALGGPFGGIAGKLVQNALGVDSMQAAETMMQTDPEALFKLKAAEIDFQKRLKELGIEEEKVHAEDRNSARDLAKSQGIWPQVSLSIGFLAIYFGLLYLLFTGDLPPMEEFTKGQLGILIGILTAAIPQILAFWFGSSAGSKQKTDHMARVKQDG